MQKNELLQWNNTIIRILAIDDARVLVIDCVKRTMPQWINSDALSECKSCEKSKLELQTEIELDDFENMNIQERRIAHERYTMIAGVLPFVADESWRSMIIDKIADEKKVSKQTVRRYLCLDLAFDDMSVLCSKRKIHKKTLTEDEKNIRWALNKFFYTSRKNSCNGVQREHNKKLNNGLPILHKVPPKRDYGRYFCIMAEKGGTSHGSLTEKLSPFFHAKKQEVNAYGR